MTILLHIWQGYLVHTLIRCSSNWNVDVFEPRQSMESMAASWHVHYSDLYA